MNPAQTHARLAWEPTAQERYKLMIEKIPLFHREIAKTVVDKKAELNAIDRGASRVEEPDIVRAFLTEVPVAFYSLMVRLLDEVGFEHRKYESK